MPRFEYGVSVSIKKRGKIQIDAPTEEQAYEKLMKNLSSGLYQEELDDLPVDDAVVEVEDWDIVEEE